MRIVILPSKVGGKKPSLTLDLRTSDLKAISIGLYQTEAFLSVKDMLFKDRKVSQQEARFYAFKRLEVFLLSPATRNLSEYYSQRLFFMLLKDRKCSYCHLPHATSQSITARGSFSCFLNTGSAPTFTCHTQPLRVSQPEALFHVLKTGSVPTVTCHTQPLRVSQQEA
ncbi:hypothetical protein J6590_084515, partial [Homalodisca vitripennis]